LNLTRNSGQSTRSMKSPFSASNAITLELHGPAITSDAGACGYGAMARRHRSFASTAVRATLRARLTIAHLLEPNPRTSEKWLPLARDYLRIATADAVHLERMLRTRADR
jgi:hypothetical protein